MALSTLDHYNKQLAVAESYKNCTVDGDTEIEQRCLEVLFNDDYFWN